jgi:hypothetical protein
MMMEESLNQGGSLITVTNLQHQEFLNFDNNDGENESSNKKEGEGNGEATAPYYYERASLRSMLEPLPENLGEKIMVNRSACGGRKAAYRCANPECEYQMIFAEKAIRYQSNSASPKRCIRSRRAYGYGINSVSRVLQGE